METISCDLLNRNNTFCQAKIFLYYHQGNFKEMFHIIERFGFNKCNHSNLKTLRMPAHCVKAENLKGWMIGAIGKY